jgi:hypothetical protein
MSRIIIVDRCSKCPWVTWDFRNTAPRCANPGVGRRLTDFGDADVAGVFPTWCPLLDVKVSQVLVKKESV